MATELERKIQFLFLKRLIAAMGVCVPVCCVCVWRRPQEALPEQTAIGNKVAHNILCSRHNTA